jgi:hypothetical protein
VAPVHPKVKAGTAAAAVAGLVVWLLGRYVLHGRVDATVTAEIYAAVPAMLTFAAGWITPSKAVPVVAVDTSARLAELEAATAHLIAGAEPLAPAAAPAAADPGPIELGPHP